MFRRNVQTGRSNPIPIAQHPGFPVVLAQGRSRWHPGDRFTLESEDGAYRETLEVSKAQLARAGHPVLWFKPVPRGAMLRLVAEPPESGRGTRYVVFHGLRPSYGFTA